MSHVYCPECGFQNPEAANYCSRCGALLEKGDHSSEATQSLPPEEVADLAHTPVEGLEGPALVVRSGGGRAGETFRPQGERTRAGGSRSCSPTTPRRTASGSCRTTRRREARGTGPISWPTRRLAKIPRVARRRWRDIPGLWRSW